MELQDKLTNISPTEMYTALTQTWTSKFVLPPQPDSILVILSQWALETGRGKFMHNFNCGNIKATPNWTGDYTYFACNEIINGKVVWFYPKNPACKFRAFKNLQDGVSNYLETIYHQFSSAWPAVAAGNPTQFVHLLKQAKYFTASEQQYTTTVVILFNEFKKTILSKPLTTMDVYSTLGIQTILKQLGFDPGVLDGINGPHTIAAIQHFQLAYGLVADGLVGNLTRAALLEALGI